jgi:hypothetical protein
MHAGRPKRPDAERNCRQCGVRLRRVGKETASAFPREAERLVGECRARQWRNVAEAEWCVLPAGEEPDKPRRQKRPT